MISKIYIPEAVLSSHAENSENPHKKRDWVDPVMKTVKHNPISLEWWFA